MQEAISAGCNPDPNFFRECIPTSTKAPEPTRGYLSTIPFLYAVERATFVLVCVRISSPFPTRRGHIFRWAQPMNIFHWVGFTCAEIDYQ
jgi:hypothetical protein